MDHQDLVARPCWYDLGPGHHDRAAIRRPMCGVVVGRSLIAPLGFLEVLQNLIHFHSAQVYRFSHH